MKLTFLGGKIPLTKTIAYNAREERYVIKPYPLVSKVTSYEETVSNLTDFYTALRKHADLGRCLLKGGLDQPLVEQSRAGHTAQTNHDWIVFDFDKVDCAPTYEGAIAAINKYTPFLANVDCIIQLSSACFNPRTTKLSAHVYALLGRQIPTTELKHFLVSLNFKYAEKELQLTDSCTALRYPIDRTVADLSKLIYIAPPKCVGFEPEIKQSLFLLKGSQRHVILPSLAPIERAIVNSKVNELRRHNQLPDIDATTYEVRGVEFLKSSEECVVHDLRPSGDGYIRFNMNGGDSYAYYINLREPGVIGNFKGEPFLLTREVAPSLFKALTKAAQSMPNASVSYTIEPLAFYATNRASQVYVGQFDREKAEIRVEPSTENAAKAWLRSFGVPIPSMLPHYDLVCDMNSEIMYEEGYQEINIFKATKYMRLYAEQPRTLSQMEWVPYLKKHCPVLFMVLDSITGNDLNALEAFLNWLAFIFQTKKKSTTAWVFTGTQGTGKGIFVRYVIRALFGDELVGTYLYNTLNSNFNGFLDGKLFVIIDEADLSYSQDKIELMSKLKHWIGEEILEVRDLYKSERRVLNYSNFMFLSNSHRVVVVEDGDRRMSVAEPQEHRLLLRPNEFAVLEREEELNAFSNLLGAMIVDEPAVRIPYGGRAKEMMYDATHTITDLVARAIHNGDSYFFYEHRPHSLAVRAEANMHVIPTREYDELLKAMADNNLNILTQQDLYVLFKVASMGTKHFPESTSEQRRLYARYNLLPERTESHRCKRTKKTVRGVKVKKDWQWSEILDSMYAELFPAENVVRIK